MSEPQKDEYVLTPEELQYQEICWGLIGARQQKEKEMKGFDMDVENNEWTFPVIVNHSGVTQTGLALLKPLKDIPKNTLWIGKETILQDDSDEEEEKETNKNPTSEYPHGLQVTLNIQDENFQHEVVACSRSEVQLRDGSSPPKDIILVVGQSLLSIWDPISSEEVSLDKDQSLVLIRRTTKKPLYARSRFRVNLNDLVMLQGLEQGMLSSAS